MGLIGFRDEESVRALSESEDRIIRWRLWPAVDRPTRCADTVGVFAQMISNSKDTAPWVPPPSGQPPHVLAAWLDELMSDVKDKHYRRIDELRLIFESRLSEWDRAGLANAAGILLSAASNLRLAAPERRGILQKLRKSSDGEGRARYEQEFEQLCAMGAECKKRYAVLSQELRSQRPGLNKLLMEFELQQGELSGEIEQGIGWLYELTQHIKRDPEGLGDDIAPLESVAHYAQDRIKFLLALHAQLEKLVAGASDLLDHRARWLAQFETLFVQFDGKWRPVIDEFDPFATDGDTAQQRSQPALEAHANLIAILMQIVQANGCLLSVEQQLESLLKTLHAQVSD